MKGRALLLLALLALAAVANGAICCKEPGTCNRLGARRLWGVLREVRGRPCKAPFRACERACEPPRPLPPPASAHQAPPEIGLGAEPAPALAGSPPAASCLGEEEAVVPVAGAGLRCPSLTPPALPPQPPLQSQPGPRTTGATTRTTMTTTGRGATITTTTTGAGKQGAAAALAPAPALDSAAAATASSPFASPSPRPLSFSGFFHPPDRNWHHRDDDRHRRRRRVS